MKTKYIFILLLTTRLFSQDVWHVKPYGGNLDYSTTANDGRTFETAWTLHEALTNYHGTVGLGDIIYLHQSNGSITNYQGHFSCTLVGNSWNDGDFVRVMSYPGEFATINGNLHDGTYPSPLPTGMDAATILWVYGKYIHFENIRITCFGNFTRMINNSACNANDTNFHGYTGVNHDPLYEEPCKFINMIIDNIPGVGFASWQETVNTEIYGCLMYYNGYMSSNRTNCNTPWNPHDNSTVSGMENCIYTQNDPLNGETRLFKNNIFSNNYKSGIALLSAGPSPSIANLAHYNIDQNVFVNNGGPLRSELPNLLMQSYSTSSSVPNFIEDVDVTNNVFYYNTSNDISGISTLRCNDVRIRNNEFYHGTAAVELNALDRNMTFESNFYVGKRIKVLASVAQYNGNGNPADAWFMDDNIYYTSNPTNLFIFPGYSSGTTLANFQSLYNTGLNNAEPTSLQYDRAFFTPPSKQNIFQNAYNPYRFHVTVYNPLSIAGNVAIDFSSFNIPSGMAFKIYDAENYFDSSNNTDPNPLNRKVLSSGSFSGGSINFLIDNSPGFELPRPLSSSGKTSFVTQPVHSNSNFRVFILELECEYPYDLLKTSLTDSGTIDHFAQNNLKFGPSYTATDSSIISAEASNEILFVNDCLIASDDFFLAKIESVVCPTIYDLSSRAVNTSQPKSNGNEKQMTATDIVSIYPNPNTGIFNIESRTDASITSVVITRLDNAKKIFDLTSKNEKIINIDIAKEMAGLYAVQVYLSDGQIFTKNIIKQW
jgi:hypothetical protein